MSLLNSQISVTSTPLVESAARGIGTLDSDQQSVVIGQPIHIVFGRRSGDYGGVLVSPPATEARFESYVDGGTTYIKAYYQLVLSDGEIGRIQVRDVFQQSCRVGTSYTTYNTRAGQWTAGNTLSSSVDVPQFCGTGGSYEGLTMMSFENAISDGFDQWKRQVHVFVRNGIKVQRLIEQDTDSSNNYADLVYYLLQRTSRLAVAQIDVTRLTSAARFLVANDFRCDTLLVQSGNMADWLQQTAPLFLLRRARVSGKEALKPLLPVNADGTINTSFVPWTYTFTNQHVLKDGFEVRYTALSERKPFAVLMMWRQQPDDDIGLVRTTEVRYFGTATSGPYEQHDLTQYVTTEDHAVKIGAYILARRRYVEHTLRLVVSPGAFVGSISVGDIVRVNTSNTDQNGETLTHDYLYEVDNIGKTLSGNIELALTHFPIDSQGRSLVALDVSRAKGTNYLLPTGRDAVSCDQNDPFDVTLLPDWPTIDWDFDFDFPFDVPIGDGTWTYDPTDQEWGNPDYVPTDNPDVLFPDGVNEPQGPDDLDIPVPNVTQFNTWSGTPPAVTISDATVSYPVIRYYNVFDPGYAVISGSVAVDRFPYSNLEVNLESAYGDVRVVIPVPEPGEEAGPYESTFAIAAALDQPFYSRTGSISVESVDGGGYESYTLPEGGVDYTISPYVATASLSVSSITTTQADFTVSLNKPCLTDNAVITLAVGNIYWDWDAQTESWRWITDQYPAQDEPVLVEVEFPANTALIGDYRYDAIAEDWVYIGDDTPGTAPTALEAPSDIVKTVTLTGIPEDIIEDYRVWIVKAAQGGFSAITFDPARVGNPPPVPVSDPALLLHFDEIATWDGVNFLDSAGTVGWGEIAVNRPALSGVDLTSSVTKFGASALDVTSGVSTVAFYVDNYPESGPIYAADSDWALDFWIYSTQSSYSPLSILATFGLGDPDVYFEDKHLVIDGSVIRLYSGPYSHIYPIDISTTDTISANTWHHIAVEYYSGTFYIYLDGNVSSDTDTVSYAASFNYWDMIASTRTSYPARTQLNGYVDEVRLSPFAPYQGQSFTPRVTPYDDPT